MSDKTASNKGILRISGKKERNVTAYKHTKDISTLYDKKSLYFRWVAGLSE
jgi:hypothetical protein